MTTARELITALLAPYANLPRYRANGKDLAWRGLVEGAAEIVADALLANPGSDFWRNPNPIEDGPDGAAIRWYRESEAGDPEADANFNAYATAPGCEHIKRSAKTIRWLIEREFSVREAICYLSDAGDYRISETNPDFPGYIRERLIRSLPASMREEARRYWNNNYND